MARIALEVLLAKSIGGPYAVGGALDRPVLFTGKEGHRRGGSRAHRFFNIRSLALVAKCGWCWEERRAAGSH